MTALERLRSSVVSVLADQTPFFFAPTAVAVFAVDTNAIRAVIALVTLEDRPEQTIGVVISPWRYDTCDAETEVTRVRDDLAELFDMDGSPVRSRPPSGDGVIWVDLD